MNHEASKLNTPSRPSFQPRDPGTASEQGLTRPGRHQMGHGFVSVRGLRHLLLLPVEGHLDVGQGGLVHGPLPLRRPPDPPRERSDPPRFRRGD